VAKIYFSNDGDLDLLKDKVVSVLGYGNQGTAQAHNLRDSGVKVMVGNTRDASFEQAVSDGFEAYKVKKQSNGPIFTYCWFPMK